MSLAELTGRTPERSTRSSSPYSPRSRASLLNATPSAAGSIRASSSVSRLLCRSDSRWKESWRPSTRCSKCSTRACRTWSSTVSSGVAAFCGAVPDASAVRRMCRIRAISRADSRMVRPLRRKFLLRGQRRITPALLGAFSCGLRERTQTVGWASHISLHRRGHIRSGEIRCVGSVNPAGDKRRLSSSTVARASSRACGHRWNRVASLER
jgi:hypothetical protein